MFSFGTRNPKDKFGAIVDIGSGSVGVAIVRSAPHEASPEIVWSHRERMLIKDIASTDDSLKAITTSLVNAFLELGNRGVRTLHDTYKTVAIAHLQVSVSAPWSYTVTKMVNFSDDHPFKVDREMITQLTETAQKQALSEIDGNNLIEKLGLKIISDITISVRLNGYNINNPVGQEGRELSIAHVSAITQQRLLKALSESHEKIIPKAQLSLSSFILTFYCVLRDLHPDTSEICLIDVTSEATEIGIVRDGVLMHTTHAAFGTFTIAREISALCGISKEEAYTFMKGGESFVRASLSEAKQAELAIILESYEEKISELFARTGDALSIPKSVFLHTDTLTEKFFSDHITKAAQKATKSSHQVHLVTSDLFEDDIGDDTAIGLSAHYFHTQINCEILDID